ncbi:MAG: TPM domain-containing protein [Phycisphaerales bacterium]
MKRLLVLPVLLALFYTSPLALHAVCAQPPAPPPVPPATAPQSAPGTPIGQPASTSDAAPALVLPPQTIDYPTTPELGVYVSDRAVILSIDSTKLINKAAAEIFLKSNVPVYVVTIRSIEHMGGDAAGGVEKYGRDLFNRWGVGNARDNRGVLVLYSRGDEKIRVQLGSGWPESANADAQRIVNDTIVPPIRRNAAGEGLLEGVKALGLMIDADTAKRFPERAAELSPANYAAPATPMPQQTPLSWLWLGVGVIILVVIGFVMLALKSRPGEEG